MYIKKMSGIYDAGKIKYGQFLTINRIFNSCANCMELII